MFRLAFLAAAVVAISAPAAMSPVVAQTVVKTSDDAAPYFAPYAPITIAEVEAAQRAWGNSLVAIATEYDTNGIAAATRLAGQVLDVGYGYDMGPVLFKPTLTTVPQTFRMDREGALAYFVGGNPAYPSDTGFALKGWRSYGVENAGIIITGNSAITMGKIMLTDKNGVTTTVDKTWGFVRDGDGKLRIVLHHSSLPYSPS